MSLQTYMDLIENPIKKWISIFCKKDSTEMFNDMGDQYCVLFPEKINGENKCIMLYISIVYPPFEKVDYKIVNNKYLDIIIKNLYHHMRGFYLETARSVLENKSGMNFKILQNTGLCISDATYTLLPYPIDQDYMEKNMDLYNSERYTERTYREIFNNYEKHAHRLGINVEILDIKPPKKIFSDLLGNYQSVSDSDTDSDSDILNILE